jgi:hypothetical protein
MTELAAQMWRAPADFVHALGRLRQRQGELHTLRDLRYADLPRVEHMAQQLATEQQRVGERALVFLSDDKAFDGQQKALTQIAAELPGAATATHIGELLSALDEQAGGLDLLSEQLGSLPGGDAVQRTAILDRIALLYADINRLRADARQRRRSLGAAEQRAEFGAQFKLFGQAVENALELADTPEKCDEALTHLLAQLEEIEARFAEQEEFLADIAAQREIGVRSPVRAPSKPARRATAPRQGIGRCGRPRAGWRAAPHRQHDRAGAGAQLLSRPTPCWPNCANRSPSCAAWAPPSAPTTSNTRLKTARDQACAACATSATWPAGTAGGTLKLGAHAFTINKPAA